MVASDEPDPPPDADPSSPSPTDESSGGRPPDRRRSQGGGLADWMASLREVTPYLSLGWQLAGTTAVPPLIGYVVDRGLGTLPWGVLVGCLLGLAAAGVQLKRLQDDFGR